MKNKGRHPKAKDLEQEAVKTRPGARGTRALTFYTHANNAQTPAPNTVCSHELHDENTKCHTSTSVL